MKITIILSVDTVIGLSPIPSNSILKSNFNSTEMCLTCPHMSCVVVNVIVVKQTKQKTTISTHKI